MSDYAAANRSLWNAWAALHKDSPFYDLEGFKAGASSLRPIEIDELGDVTGKSLLHLQCHFGMDTLSWARQGARVTGVDFSPDAIALARSLSDELAIDATFMCANVYDLPEILDERFDIVFTSYGVLCWLPRLDQWARIVARYLKPGGTFYMVEFHPVASTVCDKSPYVFAAEPGRYEVNGSYAEPVAGIAEVAYEWTHPLGDVISALCEAGLAISFVHEFPFCVYRFFPFTEEAGPGRYVMKEFRDSVPCMFSIRATKR